MRSHDWTLSPLGPPQSWPQSLRSVVGLLLNSKFPMFVAWGRDLGFLYNDPYAEILGAKHPAALGSRFHDIWSEIWPDISPLIDAAMAGEATFREDLPLVMNRKGFDEQTWFTFSYSPVRDESGNVAGMFCAVEETTPKILAERALRQREGDLRELNETLERRVAVALAERKVLADILEKTGTFVQVADLDFNWLAINTAAANEFERIFGIRPKLGDNMLSLLTDKPEHQAAVRAVWSRAIGGEEFTETGEFGDPTLDRRIYEMKFNVLRDGVGKPIGAYQFVEDVTERVRAQERLKMAEEALRQAQKLESIGQLTGGIAHDFNNLLAVIFSGLQLLERHEDRARRSAIMQGMRQAVERGAGLIRHLLAFSGRRAMSPMPIDLEKQLGDMREMLTQSLRGDLKIEMRFPKSLWLVKVDPGELELTVLNLCVNARDAMPSGGTISISAENDDGSHGGFVKLRVADEGTGMPPEVRARAFEPFFTTKGVGKGSGLGLAQVHGFAQQSGGRVTIDTAVGRGTTVTLWLPQSAEVPDSDAKSRQGRLKPIDAPLQGTVLLVEDDLGVAELTVQMLRHLGLDVVHATDPAGGIEILDGGRKHVDVVLSDILMPGGMSGLDLARLLGRSRPELPVILTTGYAGASNDATAEGVSLLMKPYTIEALGEALRNSLATRGNAPPTEGVWSGVSAAR